MVQKKIPGEMQDAVTFDDDFVLLRQRTSAEIYYLACARCRKRIQESMRKCEPFAMASETMAENMNNDEAQDIG